MSGNYQNQEIFWYHYFPLENVSLNNAKVCGFNLDLFFCIKKGKSVGGGVSDILHEKFPEVLKT